ncbi:MAG: endonuclease NucS [Patescibacteria group bacterium]|nr:endonuclease NucS [Patescibacteria group bacterium]
MELSNNQIQKLLKWFVVSSETKKRCSENRKRKLEENHKWIQSNVIQKMSDKELDEKFLEYYKSGGGEKQNLNQIYRDRIIRDKKRFREVILYLLNKEIDIKERINQILEEKYRIKGFGKAILTSFLMDCNPDKYCLWNSKTDMGFSTLGWKIYDNKDSKGDAYLKILEALQELINLNPELNLTFDDVDLFLHTISAEEEGKEVVRAIKEDKEIFMPAIENIKDTEQDPSEIKGVQNMEFVMERYLEDFIETNFSQIFDANIELYQGEENSGRQFPTSIGNIDLLAIDNENKEFIIIELKKGKSSDVVVGQILRYMSWVREKLSAVNGYSVRGIIVVKEKDEKLEYALKLVPNVRLFLYEVSFELKKVS